MKTGVGLWIDHRKAVLVAFTKGGEEITLIKSNAEKQLRPAGGSRSKSAYGPQDAPPDDMRERAFMGHLNNYFDEVISRVGDAEAILIFGPGEAKRELKKRIENQSIEHVVDIETADKMSDRQIVANVRRHFQVPGRKQRLDRRSEFIYRGRTSQSQWPVGKMGVSKPKITAAKAEGASRKRAKDAMERRLRISAPADDGFSRWEGEGGAAIS